MNVAVELEKLVPEVRKLVAKCGEYKAKAEGFDAYKVETVGPMIVKINDLTRDLALAEDSRRKAQEKCNLSERQRLISEAVLVEALKALNQGKIPFDLEKERRLVLSKMKA